MKKYSVYHYIDTPRGWEYDGRMGTYDEMPDFYPYKWQDTSTTTEDEIAHTFTYYPEHPYGDVYGFQIRIVEWEDD